MEEKEPTRIRIRVVRNYGQLFLNDRVIFGAGIQIPIRSTAGQILVYLLENKGMWVGREQLRQYLLSQDISAHNEMNSYVWRANRLLRNFPYYRIERRPDRRTLEYRIVETIPTSNPKP